jgi:predicted enzyme related to lactoylglutathione lyase
MSETTTISNDSTHSSLAGAITWFEVGTPDPEGARAFYGELFGWTFDVQGPYSIIQTGAGHALPGGIQDTRMSENGTPASYAVPCVQVDDVADVCRRVEALGGKVLVPATSAPNGLVYAHVVDPTGGHIGVWTPPAG